MFSPKLPMASAVRFPVSRMSVGGLGDDYVRMDLFTRWKGAFPLRIPIIYRCHLGNLLLQMSAAFGHTITTDRTAASNLTVDNILYSNIRVQIRSMMPRTSAAGPLWLLTRIENASHVPSLRSA